MSESTKKILIYYPKTDSYGIHVIIDRFVEVGNSLGLDCAYIDSLESIKDDEIVIPYSSTAALELMAKGRKTDICFLVDAYSLGEKNKIWFYLKHGYIHYDFFYSIYAYIRAVYEEKKLLRNYKNVMLVSNTDIQYLKKLSCKKTNYLCVPNGVELTSVSVKSHSSKVRLGLLSSWTNKVSFEENDWFVQSYFKKYAETHQNVELHIAGRGKYANVYNDTPYVINHGEVESLDDFFKHIDICIAANPKGCGILNRVLDAFAHKTVVLGYDAAFSGFREMKDAYASFSNYKEFKEELERLIAHPEWAKTLITNAYEQSMKIYDWNKNYNALFGELSKIISSTE